MTGSSSPPDPPGILRVVIRHMRLTQYKGFEDFRISFGKSAVILGPNNAGKSTIIAALRLAVRCARVAMRSRATHVYSDNGRFVTGHPLNPDPALGINDSNVRHEGADVETRVEVQWDTGAWLRMVWPNDEESTHPFFWIEHPMGLHVTTAAKAREALKTIGVVPPVTPLEENERSLSAEHLRAHVETALASRHFRNNIYQVSTEREEKFVQLSKFILEFTPEIRSFDVRPTFTGERAGLALSYTDAVSDIPKEISWAGDGMQIWLQVLFHLWRTNGCETVVLDEPDVFLQPDLQRRLVRVLYGTKAQTIVATHSAEIAAECDDDSIIWVDRTKRRAKRAPDASELAQLSTTLGSSFNLAIARALRARLALFFEGQDMKILTKIAAAAGSRALLADPALATIPIGGFSQWRNVDAFAWIKDELLSDSVSVYVILDRDYRNSAEVAQVVDTLTVRGIGVHVWARKELENYLLAPSIVARTAGVSEEVAEGALRDIAAEFRLKVYGEYSKHYAASRPKGEDLSTSAAGALQQFEAVWADQDRRLEMIPGKQAISKWNTMRIQGAKNISPHSLARNMRQSDVPAEMLEVFSTLEALLTKQST